MKSSLRRLIPFWLFLLIHLALPSPELDPLLFRLLFCTPCFSASPLLSVSESCVATDGQSARLSWNEAPMWGLRPDFYYCGAIAGLSSLTRGRVCRLQLLLALAIAVILGSESRGTRGHILLCQIRDFPFRRLIRLAVLRWRYSNSPPHGITMLSCRTLITTLHGPHDDKGLDESGGDQIEVSKIGIRVLGWDWVHLVRWPIMGPIVPAPADGWM
jgi:hypothetical protein